MVKRLIDLTYEEKLRNLGLFSPKKRRIEKFFPEDINTWRMEQRGARCFSVTVLGTVDMNWNTQHSLRKHIFAVRVLEHCHSQLWGCEVSIASDTKKPSGHYPGQLAPGDTAWAAGGLDQVTSGNPFQSQPFCDPAKLRDKRIVFEAKYQCIALRHPNRSSPGQF